MGVHGVDALKKVCRAVVLNEGELVDEFSFRNSKREIEDFMMKIEVFKDKAPRRAFPFPIFSFCCSTVFLVFSWDIFDSTFSAVLRFPKLSYLQLYYNK